MANTASSAAEERQLRRRLGISETTTAIIVVPQNVRKISPRFAHVLGRILCRLAHDARRTTPATRTKPTTTTNATSRTRTINSASKQSGLDGIHVVFTSYTTFGVADVHTRHMLSSLLRRALRFTVSNNGGEGREGSENSEGSEGSGCFIGADVDAIFNRVFITTPRLSTHDFDTLLRTATVMLDPFPFGGGATSLSALSQGLPVVTVPARLTVPAITAGLYRQMEMGEMAAEVGLIAADEAEYVQCAVESTFNTTWRREVGARLRERTERLLLGKKGEEGGGEGNGGEATRVVQEWAAFLSRVVLT